MTSTRHVYDQLYGVVDLEEEGKKTWASVFKQRALRLSFQNGSGLGGVYLATTYILKQPIPFNLIGIIFFTATLIEVVFPKAYWHLNRIFEKNKKD